MRRNHKPSMSKLGTSLSHHNTQPHPTARGENQSSGHSLPLHFSSFYFALFKDSVGTEFYFLTQPEKHEKEIMETYRFMKVAIPILSDIVEKNYNKQLTGNDF